MEDFFILLLTTLSIKMTSMHQKTVCTTFSFERLRYKILVIINDKDILIINSVLLIINNNNYCLY